MNPSTDIPSSMEHGGRLAELHKPFCVCGHSWYAHQGVSNPACHARELSKPRCTCDDYLPMQGDDIAERPRESVRVDGMGDNPGGGDDAAGADGEQGALGELAAIALEVRHRVAIIRSLLADIEAQNAALLERSKTWGQL